ncbi:hypothetical protein EGI31_08335 [Lacihabitans soyangensis]|uniref:Uncharacterized protein n=1 Tax=Lacihabitans soyangensis TaxID=869394 RepID=A0AAE3H2Z9_9BACT|nr:hypothetical protein [Lacihabitans soyangensis]
MINTPKVIIFSIANSNSCDNSEKKSIGLNDFLQKTARLKNEKEGFNVNIFLGYFDLKAINEWPP